MVSHIPSKQPKKINMLVLGPNVSDSNTNLMLARMEFQNAVEPLLRPGGTVIIQRISTIQLRTYVFPYK